MFDCYHIQNVWFFYKILQSYGSNRTYSDSFVPNRNEPFLEKLIININSFLKINSKGVVGLEYLTKDDFDVI